MAITTLLKDAGHIYIAYGISTFSLLVAIGCFIAAVVLIQSANKKLKTQIPKTKPGHALPASILIYDRAMQLQTALKLINVMLAVLGVFVVFTLLAIAIRFATN